VQPADHTLASSGQVVASAIFGSYASGFGGGTALMFGSLALSQRPRTPPAAALLQPRILVIGTGSLGLLGVTQLIGAHSSAAVTVTLISMISIALGIQAGR
jgi:hypothetical protein